MNYMVNTLQDHMYDSSTQSSYVISFEVGEIIRLGI